MGASANGAKAFAPEALHDLGGVDGKTRIAFMMKDEVLGTPAEKQEMIMRPTTESTVLTASEIGTEPAVTEVLANALDEALNIMLVERVVSGAMLGIVGESDETGFLHILGFMHSACSPHGGIIDTAREALSTGDSDKTSTFNGLEGEGIARGEPGTFAMEALSHFNTFNAWRDSRHRRTPIP